MRLSNRKPSNFPPRTSRRWSEILEGSSPMPQTNLLASMAVCLVSAKRLNPVLLLLFSLAWSSVASASTWYVNGVSGSDSNSCTSPTNACRTIKHSISLATSGNSIIVAPAIYTENLLTIGNSLKVIGSGANTTIVDGGGTNTVIKIPTLAPRSPFQS
jgi:hypothetical protein